MKKNQLKRFRKRLQQSFKAFSLNCESKSCELYLKFGNNLSSRYDEYCKKMLYSTLGFVIFNFIVLLLNLFLCKTF